MQFTYKMATGLSSHPGRLCRIPRPPQSITFATTAPLIAFEHASPHRGDFHLDSPSNPGAPAHNTLIFLGGLGDGLLTVPFVPPIVSSLPETWSLVEPILGSNYRQFGISSLDDDVTELEVLVKYFRTQRPDGRVVLLGHSTGSQMIMHYLLSKPGKAGDRLKIDGGIMQGCASDREALSVVATAKEINRATKVAQEYIKNDHGGHVLPKDVMSFFFDSTPVTANRWLSLSSPGPDHAGQDDYFSSDFSDERLRTTFGRLGKTETRLCWIYGENDQYVPEDMDKVELLDRWHRIARDGGAQVDEESGVLEGGSHTLKEGGAVTKNFVAKVTAFLERL